MGEAPGASISSQTCARINDASRQESSLLSALGTSRGLDLDLDLELEHPGQVVDQRRFFQLRVGVLLAILAGVCLYALRDYVSRHARTSWQRPLEVALVLVERGPLDPAALARLRGGVERLEAVLEREYVRYGGTLRPIRFRQFGPVQERFAPPEAETGSLWGALRVSLELRAYARAIDELAGLSDTDFDGSIYVRLSPPRSDTRAFVEGLGEDRGRVAVANIELSADSVDFGLFVVTHELFHLLGASDRYGPDGRTLLPEGLGEPELEPTFPQRTVEVMARGRVLAPGDEVPPSDLDELRVGLRTASEIGWLRAAIPIAPEP